MHASWPGECIMQSLRLSSVRSIGFSIPHAHLDLEKLNITIYHSTANLIATGRVILSGLTVMCLGFQKAQYTY